MTLFSHFGILGRSITCMSLSGINKYFVFWDVEVPVRSNTEASIAHSVGSFLPPPAQPCLRRPAWMKWWRGQAHLSPHLGLLLLLIHSLPLDPPALEQQWEGMARLSFERVIWVWRYLKAEVFSHETPLAFLRNTSPGHWGAPTVVSQHRCLLQLAATTSP